MNDNLKVKKPEENFAGRFGAIMSMAGMAIGLGNVWRFPYMVGSYGGGAFVLAYLICVVLIVMPLAVMEAGLGKGIGGGLMEAYEAATHNKKLSKFIGGLFSAVYGTMNFYFVAVMCASLYFMYVCVTSMWDKKPAAAIYDDAMANFGLMIPLAVIISIAVGFIVYKGVQKGIEAVSKVMVPLMFVFFIVVVFFALFAIDGIGRGYEFYLRPDFSQWAHPSLWVAAMGQALFSIGVGPGCVLIYGSHLGKKEDVTISLTTVCLLDTSIATIVGMALIPSCVAMGLDPESGSGLIFIVLPALFQQIPFGNIIGLLVFVAIFFAAITSAIAQLEVPVATYFNGLGVSRAKVAIIATIVTAIEAVHCVISPNVLNFWSDFSGNYGFIVTAGIGAIVYGWIYGVNRIREEHLNPTSDVKLGKWYTNWVKFIAIPILIIIMINLLFPFLG